MPQGLEDGLSQTATRSRDDRKLFVLNFPLDITFKSTNPHGCKLIFAVDSFLIKQAKIVVYIT